jgi:hypothetical protein
MSKKYIVSSGCSYGRLPDFTFNPFSYLLNGKELLKTYDKNWMDMDCESVVSINTSLGSQGSDWQSDSTIHTIQKLLDLGIKSEDIYCLVEWSQWHRYSLHPLHYINLDLSLFEFQKVWPGNFIFSTLFSDNMNSEDKETTNFFHNYLDIYNSHKIYSIGKIDDRIYLPVGHIARSAFERMGGDYSFLCDHTNEINKKIPVETKIKVYLDNIIRTQYFLEKNNIKYNFLFMQSTLSDWVRKGDGVLSHSLYNRNDVPMFWNDVNNKIIFNKDFNPKNDPSRDMEVVMSETKGAISQINLNNFWFYENEKYRRGGIDEFAIDNLKECGYIKWETSGDPKMKVKYGYTVDDICNMISCQGYHPNIFAYLSIWNDVIKNCSFLKLKKDFIDFITEKYWEDYYYDGITKNEITISRKEWYRVNNL